LNRPNLTHGRVLDDGDNTLELFDRKLTGALVKVDVGLLADEVGVSATDTLDFLLLIRPISCH
jgi:hypothetical protein